MGSEGLSEVVIWTHAYKLDLFYRTNLDIYDRPRINRLHHFLYVNTVTSGSHFILSTLSALTSINHLSIKYRHRMLIIHTLMHIKQAFVPRKFPWLSPPCAVIFYQIPSNVSRCPTLKSWQTGDWKANVFPVVTRHIIRSLSDGWIWNWSPGLELWRRWEFSLYHSLFTYLFWLQDIPTNILNQHQGSLLNEQIKTRSTRKIRSSKQMKTRT